MTEEAQLRPPALSAQLIASLEAIVGAEHVSVSAEDRTTYSRDCWPVTHIWHQLGRIPYPPDVVVWPASTSEVAAVIRFAASHAIPVTPYAGGSGVCGGAIPVDGGISMDVKRLDGIVDLDPESATVTVRAGMNGEHLEMALADAGFTLGHFPSSIYCSTVGGWVAARSAGQLSTLYGKIEDMVMGLEVVLADGRVLSIPAQPRRATGPDLVQLFVGSEGILGVITRVTLRIHPVPAGRVFRAYDFANVEAGLDGIRRVLQAGLRPAAIRLYDELDTMLVAGAKGITPPASLRGRLKGLIPDLLKKAQGYLLRNPEVVNLLSRFAPGRCLLVTMYEGNWERIRLEEEQAREILQSAGGRDKGEEAARHWYTHRYDVSYKQAAVFADGAFVDTMEVAAPWRELPGLYRAVRAAIMPHAIVLAHFSHAYPEGANIYFTFSTAAPSPAEAEVLYHDIWRRAMKACVDAHGALSHHHGIGMSKRDFMQRDVGETAVHVLRLLKQALDPIGILNPGKMVPPLPGPPEPAPAEEIPAAPPAEPEPEAALPAEPEPEAAPPPAPPGPASTGAAPDLAGEAAAAPGQAGPQPESTAAGAAERAPAETSPEAHQDHPADPGSASAPADELAQEAAPDEEAPPP